MKSVLLTTVMTLLSLKAFASTEYHSNYLINRGQCFEGILCQEIWLSQATYYPGKRTARVWVALYVGDRTNIFPSDQQGMNYDPDKQRRDGIPVDPVDLEVMVDCNRSVVYPVRDAAWEGHVKTQAPVKINPKASQVVPDTFVYHVVWQYVCVAPVARKTFKLDAPEGD